jgi:twitching motility two-component system response regulator PilG
MNQFSSQAINNKTDSINLYPIDSLAELSSQQANGYLKIMNDNSIYWIYLHQGKVSYATNSIEPFERLERHLRRLSHEATALKNEVRSSLRLSFETEIENSAELPPDYQAICWLIEQKYLTQEQASILIDRLIKEVFDSYILLPNQCQNEFNNNNQFASVICSLELSSLIEDTVKKLKIWQSFTPHITSLYQRPYFFSKPDATVEQQKIGKILRGFNFRQLSAMLNQDELVLVKKFYPLIANKTIILREPQPPFDQIPKFSKDNLAIISRSLSQQTLTDSEDINIPDLPNNALSQKQWKIVCIDDSPTILNEITRFLERDDFSVFPITEPLKALMKIIRIQPDLILLDVGMPNIDGYKLCSLIRKYSAFKDTPIVMVTGNKGLIDRAKARMAGATDYMTKPFTQSDLLNMVFRYLT